MDSQPCVFLGIKVKPGPIERHKVENFSLDNTVDSLKSEAEKKTNVPSDSLELIHHGKILRGETTLLDSGVKNGEMVHVVKKKMQPAPVPAPTFTDAELQQLNASLRTLGCTPNAPGWTRAMQLLNDESAMSEIMESAPSLSEECVTLSILHEVELLAALGANIQTMRRGASAHPHLPTALRHLTRLVRTRSGAHNSTDNVPTSGFAYSLEALSDDEDAEEEDGEEADRSPITQAQLAAALQAATESVSSTSSRDGGAGGSRGSLLRLLQAAGAGEAGRANAAPADSASPTAGGGRPMITPEMFSEAISEAIQRATGGGAGTPMEQSTAASSSQSPSARDEDFVTQLQHMHEMGLLDDALNVRALLICSASSSQSPSARDEDFVTQLQHMHEMGLLDDALNVRALLICSGDVNAAINLVFSGAIGDD